MELMEIRRRLMMVAGGVSGMFKKFEAHIATLSGITNPDYVTTANSVTITHGLGEVPDYVFVYPKQRWTPPNDTGGVDVRVIQYAYYIGIGGRLVNGAYELGSYMLTRLYTNQSNQKYEQFDTTKNFITGITANSVTLIGNSFFNCGIRNGDYWVMIGKIADKYLQGEQVIVN